MKILHTADTHIGYSAYNKLDANGINQRESDVCDAFARVIDFALDEGVDLILHSGDLFDTVRPSNRAIGFVMEQLLRVSGAGIPMVIISGNHETPRLRETGSVFRIFQHIEGLHLSFSGPAESFALGELKVHCLPHCADKDLFERELDSMQPDPDFKFNIAMLHSAVSGLSVFRMNEFNELMATGSQLEGKWDYVALGHYHEQIEVGENVVYAGATERFGFGQVGQPKGFVLLDPEKGEWEFREIQVRPMIDLKPVDCKGLDHRQIMEAVEQNLDRDLEGAIVRQRFIDIDRRTLGLLDIGTLKKLASDSLNFEIKPSVKETDSSVSSEDAAFDSLEREFVAYIERTAIEGADPEVLETLGLEYLSGGSD